MTERLMLVRLSSLGDVVCALPAAVLVRRARPHAELHWLVEDRFAAVVERVREIDRVHVFPRRRLVGPAAPAALLSHLRRLRSAGPFDAVVDLQGNLKSALHVRALRARRRIGPSRSSAREGAQLAYDVPIEVARGLHRWRRAAWLAAPLFAGEGCELPREAPAPTIDVEERAAQRAERELAALGRPAVLLHVGTSPFARFKRWPAERFGALARRLAGLLGGPVGVLHGPGEEELAARASREAEAAAMVLAPDGGLPLLVERLRRADLLIGCDSGPLLLASALGTATITLFGPKDPATYAPPFGRGRVVRRPPPCAPCSLRRCDDPVCMTGIEVDLVESAVRDALRSLAPVGGA